MRDGRGGEAVATDAPGAGTGLEDYVCLALHQAVRAMNARYRLVLDPLGLTYPQHLVLVWLRENGPAPVGAVARGVGLDYSTLSPLLKRLQASGLVSRERGAADERSVLVRFTDRGRRLAQDLLGLSDDIRAATGMTEEDLSRLVDRLREMTASLGRSTAQADQARGTARTARVI